MRVQNTVYGCIIIILTAIKVRTLGDVAIGCENQLHILDNALATQEEEEQGKDRRHNDTHGLARSWNILLDLIGKNMTK